ncbi:hypothetical protein AB1Y20_009532 [Prymnesium parvum]|uniref:GtrA-like protein domain-containing protein n=1 Tax=Prymnesium parvum TaxID=97485 RepID=A0AB34K1Q2_PRYPA
MSWAFSATSPCAVAASCGLPRLELPLAQSCRICGHQPPRFLFFAISGTICNAAQLAMDRAILVLLPEEWWAPTACWTLSYALSVAFRHASHAILVFGPHGDPPLIALSKTYLAYLSTILASTVVNLALVAGASLSHELALILTASFSVGWSYLALSYSWRRTKDSPSSWRSCCVVDSVHGQRWYCAHSSLVLETERGSLPRCALLLISLLRAQKSQAYVRTMNKPLL